MVKLFYSLSSTILPSSIRSSLTEFLGVFEWVLLIKFNECNRLTEFLRLKYASCSSIGVFRAELIEWADEMLALLALLPLL